MIAAKATESWSEWDDAMHTLLHLQQARYEDRHYRIILTVAEVLWLTKRADPPFERPKTSQTKFSVR